MKILTIVGKVDTRVLAYPIARALSLSGLTAMISDDGAYRRLYHGPDWQGTVSGVDVSVGYISDEDLLNSLNKSGVPYDNIVFISSEYIPEHSTGVVACHGVDRSMMGKTPQEEAEEEEAAEAKKAEASEQQAPKKKRGFGKKASENEEESEESEETESIENEQQVDEEPKEPEVKDQIIIPPGMPSIEVQISYATVPKKDIIGIQLKDGLLSYIYGCEEQKEIPVFPDKNYNKTLATILNRTLDMDINEAVNLLSRSEYIQGK